MFLRYITGCYYIIIVLDFKLSPCSERCILLLGHSQASEFYVPMFRNTLSVPPSWVFFLLKPPLMMEQCVPKRRYIKYIRQGIISITTNTTTHNMDRCGKKSFFISWRLLSYSRNYPYFVAPKSVLPCQQKSTKKSVLRLICSRFTKHISVTSILISSPHLRLCLPSSPICMHLTPRHLLLLLLLLKWYR
jgi:hypothetical protein